MKKTLIALAALAATGATFAQATISGAFGMSWQQDPAFTTSGGHTQGLRVQDGEIYLTATEDLGGGMSATARGGFTMRGRGTAIVDRDGTVTLAGPLGSLTAGAVRSCGNLVTVQSGVVTGTAYSANETQNAIPLDKCSMVDVVAFTAPVGPVMLTGTYGEFGSRIADTSSSDAGNATGITFTDVQGVYKAGPLMLGANATFFAAVGTYKIIDGQVRTRFFGSYDAGVAKLGAGYQIKTGGAADQYVASVAVPMGNTTLGLDYTARMAQGTFDNGTSGAAAAYALGSARDGDKASSSLGVGMTYSFSKTTSLNVSYITYTDAGANSKYGTPVAASAQVMNDAAVGFTPTVKTAAVAANNFPAGTTSAILDTEYRIRLMKTF